MKIISSILFGLLLGNISAQDFLIFGKSYPLINCSAEFPNAYPNEINLPIEYTDIDKKIEIKYNKSNPSEHLNFSYLLDGTEVATLLVNQIDTISNIADTVSKTIELAYFIDTVVVDRKNIDQFKPYIKTKTGDIHFCGFNIIKIEGNTIRNITCGNLNDNSIFGYYWPSFNEGSVFVINRLY